MKTFHVTLFYFLLGTPLLMLLGGCSNRAPAYLELMPAPAIYDMLANDSNPTSESVDGNLRVLFATDRSRDTSLESGQAYSNQRGNIVRLGEAKVRLQSETIDWTDIPHLGNGSSRQSKIAIEVESVETFGILNSSLNRFSRPYFEAEVSMEGEQHFISQIEHRLEGDKNRRIRIYVHGFRTPFEHPLLVSAELMRFMDFDGAVIAYSWPAQSNHFGYLGDVETTGSSAFMFRQFLEFLIHRVDFVKLDIIGFSAGTRLVTSALHQIALKYEGHLERDDIASKFGNIILAGSDLDQQVFSGYLTDRILDFSDQFSIYFSPSDRALGISGFVFGRERLGQHIDSSRLHPSVVQELMVDNKLNFIDVSGLSGITENHGHAYIRSSPQVSSDIILTLLSSLPPSQRGLVRESNDPVWRFPADYLSNVAAVTDSVKLNQH